MTHSSELPNRSAKLSGRTRNADAELLHARLECGSVHAEERCGAVGAGNPPVGFLKRGDDFLPFRVVESRPQIALAVTAHRRRIASRFAQNGAFARCSGTNVQFVRRHPENRAG